MSNDKEYKTCSICCISTRTEEDTIFFGDWMESSNLQVHYFCLLLSTNLPQNGSDFTGILGFLLRDIRNEIKLAAGRTCCYCGKMHASIECNKCKEYFHLVCGFRENCLFQFSGEFLSYCDKCLPYNDLQKKWLNKPPKTRCYICHELMGDYHPTKWIYGACCNIGFAHSACMQQYALNAGYYLRCPWCRNVKFRELVRLQGIFVPDRDANWERQRDAYKDLHRGHRRCDAVDCLCPQGRDYSSSKWLLVNCMLCGSSGAHNPICITKNLKSRQAITDFKCDTCSATERDIQEKTLLSQQLENPGDGNTSIYMVKTQRSTNDSTQKSPSVSDDETLSTSNSVVTVVSSGEPLKSMLKSSENNLEESQFTVEEKINNEQNVIVGAALKNNVNNTIETTKMDASNNEACANSAQDKQCPPVNINETAERLLLLNNESDVESSHEENEDSWKMFEVFHFEESEEKGLNCKGTLTIRIDMSEARFSNKSLDQILEEDLIEDRDIIARSDYTGIFRLMDSIIEEYANKS